MSIAYSVWGDSSFWYMIADANGLDGSETLTEGVDLIIPNKVHNSHNTSDVYRVYDPNEAIGNTSPTAAKPPKHQSGGGCGIMGQILLVVIAVVVAYFTAGLALSAMGVAGTTTSAMMAAATLPEMAVAGAVGGAAGSIVSQGVGLVTGIQSKFDWGAVGMAAIGGAVGGALGKVSWLQGGFGPDVLRGALGNAITQGIGLATGLQQKFDWAGVAAAGVMAGVTGLVSRNIAGAAHPEVTINNGVLQLTQVPATFGNQFISGMAGMLAGAATRTLVNGSDFGDNIMAMLPDVIGQTIGNMVAQQMEAYDAPKPDDSIRVVDGKIVAPSFIPVDTSHLQEIVNSLGMPTFATTDTGVAPVSSVTINGQVVQGNQPYKQPSVDELNARYKTTMERAGATDMGEGVYSLDGHTYRFDPHYILAQTFDGPNGTTTVGPEKPFDTLQAVNDFLKSPSPDGNGTNFDNHWNPIRAETDNKSPYVTVVHAGAVDIGGDHFQATIYYDTETGQTQSVTLGQKDYAVFIIEHEDGHHLFYAATSGNFSGTERQMDIYGLHHTPGVSVPSHIVPDPVPGYPPDYVPPG